MERMDNRLVFYGDECVPQLQDMAAFKVAVSMTLGYATVFTKFSIFNYSEYQIEKKIYKKMSRDLKIPAPLERMIRKYIFDSYNEMVLFNEFLHFGTNDVAITKEIVSNIVWKTNTKIDQLSTAINLVNSAKLGEIFKFCVMCEFCMEEKIHQAWFELQDRSFIEKQSFRSNPALIYWICVLTGDFSKILEYNDAGSVDKRVISTLTIFPSNYTAIEYFFNRLNVDDRIEVGAEIDRGFDPVSSRSFADCKKFLISKYTESEQYRLFSTSDYAASLFYDFSHSYSYDYLDDALKTWNYIKHFISGDQVVKILQKMSYGRNDCGNELNDFLTKYLTDFWGAMPSNLKKYMFNPKRKKFITDFVFDPYRVDEEFNELVQRDGRILIMVLSDADLDYRKRFWDSELDNIVNRIRPSSLKTILNMCVPCDEMATSKKKVMALPSMRKYFVKMIELRKFSLLNEFLEILIDGGPSEIIDAKRNLFKEKINWFCSIKYCEQTEESVAAINDFIKVVFGDDTKAESEFKKKIIVESLYHFVCIREKSAIIYVSEGLCEATLLAEVKNELLKRCIKDMSESKLLYGNQLEWISRQTDTWGKLLEWCLGNTSDVNEFLVEKSKQKGREWELFLAKWDSKKRKRLDNY